MLAASKKVIRGAIEARGFYLCRREVLPYGIDFLNDISRIAPIMGIDIRTFFDVGAWHGQVSECALTEFPDAQIVAFEPNPECFAKLERLFANGRFSAHQVALSDADATGELFCNEGTRRSLVFRDANVRSISIKCLTVDSFCKQNSVDRVDVLKIDTEGADMAVLRGARETLAIRGVRFVYSEFFNDGRGTSLQQLTEFLQPLGFRFIATRTDFVVRQGNNLFVCANALFFRGGN